MQITGDRSTLCEACHIIPYSRSKNYDPYNGLLLTASVHKLFDNYLITICAQTHKVIFSPFVLENSGFERYIQYNGYEICSLSEKTSEYLKDHNHMFFTFNNMRC